MLIQGNCLKIIPELGQFDCLFADPPDNIGLNYQGYRDERADYRSFLWDCFNLFVRHAGISWVSFNSKWSFMVGSLVERLLTRFPEIDAKIFIVSYTFGQHNNKDCGDGYRPLLRLKHKKMPLYPDQIKVPSQRQIIGDKRAKPGGCVPLDHWEFPKVTGNSYQRRSWHPTQLNEGIIERAVLLSTKEGGTVLDVFSGTGTTIRVCKRLKREVTSIEISPYYCERIRNEHGNS